MTQTAHDEQTWIRTGDIVPDTPMIEIRTPDDRLRDLAELRALPILASAQAISKQEVWDFGATRSPTSKILVPITSTALPALHSVKLGWPPRSFLPIVCMRLAVLEALSCSYLLPYARWCDLEDPNSFYPDWAA